MGTLYWRCLVLHFLPKRWVVNRFCVVREIKQCIVDHVRMDRCGDRQLFWLMLILGSCWKWWRMLSVEGIVCVWWSNQCRMGGRWRWFEVGNGSRCRPISVLQQIVGGEQWFARVHSELILSRLLCCVELRKWRWLSDAGHGRVCWDPITMLSILEFLQQCWEWCCQLLSGCLNCSISLYIG